MRSSRTRFAILGALTSRPMSGYDLKRFFEESVDFFWRESYGQIYPMLRALEKEGLVAALAEAESDRGRLKHKITPAGRAALTRWLREPAEPQVSRLEILLKMLFARQAEPGVTAQQIDRFRAHHAGKLAMLESAESRLRSELADRDELPLWLLTLSFGRRQARAMLEWCDEADALFAGEPGGDKRAAASRPRRAPKPRRVR